MSCPNGSRKKSGVPDYIWVDARDYVPSDWITAMANAAVSPTEMIKADTFCSSPPPAFPNLDNLSNLFSPAYRSNLIQFAKAQKWFEVCECVPENKGCPGKWRVTWSANGTTSQADIAAYENDVLYLDRSPISGCSSPSRIMSSFDGRVVYNTFSCSSLVTNFQVGAFTKDNPSCVNGVVPTETFKPAPPPPPPGTPPTVSPPPPPPSPPPVIYLPGIKGDKGDTGEKGDKGDKGDKGEDAVIPEELVQKVTVIEQRVAPIPNLVIKVDSLIENFTLFDNLLRELNVNFNFQFGIGNTSNPRTIPDILTAIYEIVACEDIEGEPITINDVESINYQSDTPLHSALLVLSRLPDRGKEQAGGNSPTIYYAGWASFGSTSHNSPRESIQYAYSRFNASCNSTRFSFCCTNGAKASVILYRKKVFNL